MADNTVDLQEFMIMPVGASCFSEGIRMCVEIYQSLKILLKKKNLSTAVGDEGGFAPDLKDSREILELILEAVKNADMSQEKILALPLMRQPVNYMTEKKTVTIFLGRVR